MSAEEVVNSLLYIVKGNSQAVLCSLSAVAL